MRSTTFVLLLLSSTAVHATPATMTIDFPSEELCRQEMKGVENVIEVDTTGDTTAPNLSVSPRCNLATASTTANGDDGFLPCSTYIDFYGAKRFEVFVAQIEHAEKTGFHNPGALDLGSPCRIKGYILAYCKKDPKLRIMDAVNSLTYDRSENLRLPRVAPCR